MAQKNTISAENHKQVFDRLVAAGVVGMHNPPQKKVKK